MAAALVVGHRWRRRRTSSALDRASDSSCCRRCCALRGDCLAHPAFSAHQFRKRRCRRVASLDIIGPDRTMIPLGSCTMKLNGTTEMLPVSWRGFIVIHSFAGGRRCGLPGAVRGPGAHALRDYRL
ncbi:MAG: hypothetical protein U5L11_15320 [Arhodomonas sp.]|nr:hypothetical protein [Arhodomonas sp.]